MGSRLHPLPVGQVGAQVHAHRNDVLTLGHAEQVFWHPPTPVAALEEKLQSVEAYLGVSTLQVQEELHLSRQRWQEAVTHAASAYAWLTSICLGEHGAEVQQAIKLRIKVLGFSGIMQLGFLGSQELGSILSFGVCL